MIVSFADQGTEDIFNGQDTKAARKTCPETVWKAAQRKLDQLNSVSGLYELRIPPGNELHPLTKDRKGQHAIRVNKQYRICFHWTDVGPEDVEITDYH
jgi:proteic killer suppression protein